MESKAIICFLVGTSLLCIRASIIPSSTLDDLLSIKGYHFHTYFDHRNTTNIEEAINFRTSIQERITSGELKECRINFVNFLPRGPHLMGEYETCCNSTSLPAAMSFFIENRGNLSVLFHPLTRWELLDHTKRAMFLGPPVKMDVSILSVDLFDDVDVCGDDEIEYSDINNLIL
ncbi:unnamed protein product [Allacma fusca]|uniref:DOPA 4,5-dioxygenase n=1 Tax=Allacma fusca TaxID=39272 RepID=A0A8J2NRD0_9HEXA|nr:unnamed protein product [Allacma fusca]